MRGFTTAILFFAVCSPTWAQTGNSFITGDGSSRAPAVTMHCVGSGNVAIPCGTNTQPLYVAGSSPLANSSNQATQILSGQSVAAASGTPQDTPYTGGSGSAIALLKGLFSVLTTGISAGPESGTLISRSAIVPATQSTQLFPPNAVRHVFALQAPAGSALWVNFLGGVAAPNGTDCVQLGAGALYESGQFVTRSAVTVYAPVAVSIAAWEG
jgi:hypothetical protein